MKLAKRSDDQMDCDNNNNNNSNEAPFYDLADFAYQPDGSLTVAFTTVEAQSPIHVYKVELALNADYTGLEGTCRLTSTINLEQQAQQAAKKTRVLFTNCDSAATLCVQMERPRSDSLHFYAVNTADEVWTLQGSVECESRVSSVASSKGGQGGSERLLVAYTNGRVGYVDTAEVRETLMAGGVPGLTEGTGAERLQMKKL